MRGSVTAIPLRDIYLLKRHASVELYYALHQRGGKIFLLTSVWLGGEEMLYADEAYTWPYGTSVEVSQKSLAEIDRDAYNRYMTRAKG